MTTKHTPGPWEVSAEHNGTFVRAGHGGLVASMESGNQLMRDVDARLIAAAPELLALAHDVATLAETGITFEELRRRANAALGKVNGK